MNNSHARLMVFLLTFLVLTLNVVAVYIMLRMGVGPSGGITWQEWRMLTLLAAFTLGLQVLSSGSGLSMAPVSAGLVTWLIVPAGWPAKHSFIWAPAQGLCSRSARPYLCRCLKEDAGRGRGCNENTIFQSARPAVSHDAGRM
jgi:hypothetical protein